MDLHIDFETRSELDLKKVGVHVYAAHPSTEVLCMAYAFGDEPIHLWKKGESVPARVNDHIFHGGLVWGHNVAFESALINRLLSIRYDWPVLSLQQSRCTMILAYAMSLPGALENAATAVGLDIHKDDKGRRIMLQLCKPRMIKNGEVVWWEDEEKYERLYAYCRQDVEVERALHQRLLPLSQKERDVWELDQNINDRGICVDLQSVRTLISLVAAEKKRLDEAMRDVTGNQVATCNSASQLTSWLKEKGLPVNTVGKNDVSALLKYPGLPPECKTALLCRQEAAKSSTAKLQAMDQGVGNDGRMRGLFQYHGASTGRWAGRRVQLHNLPRPNLKFQYIEDIFARLGEPTGNDRDYIDLLYGPVLGAVSDCLRGLLVAAPGNVFYAGDFSSIEARVLAWLAGEEKVLEVFKKDGDLYRTTAAAIYRIPEENVDKTQRQVGKVAVLSLGYQGGSRAFQKMAAIYGLEITDSLAKSIKYSYRRANPFIVRYWAELEIAAKNAIKRPGTPFQAGAKGRWVTFLVKGSFLWCQLPSKRVLCYPYPKIQDIKNPMKYVIQAITYMGPYGPNKKWEMQPTYGGKLAENITQAVARDLLAEAMLRVEAAGYPIVLHVHDEIVSEVKEGLGTLQEYERLMAETPSWAMDLPMKVEGWVGKRYRK